MGNITVRNQTGLTDYSALIRTGLYLAGQTDEAEEGGYRYQRKDTFAGPVIKISEEAKY